MIRVTDGRKGYFEVGESRDQTGFVIAKVVREIWEFEVVEWGVYLWSRELVVFDGIEVKGGMGSREYYRKFWDFVDQNYRFWGSICCV